MKTKYFFLFTAILFLLSCSPSVVGIHSSDVAHSNLILELKKSGEFHYFFLWDTSNSEGYGEYFVKNKKLHLKFDELADLQDSIYFVKEKEHLDSISIELIPIDSSFNYCTITGTSGDTWFRLNYNRKGNEKVFKKLLFDESLFLEFKEYDKKMIWINITEPGEYEIYFKMKKGAEMPIFKTEKIFDIKKNTKEELVIHLGDSIWKWNLKKNSKGYFYKFWKPFFRKRIIQK